MSDAYYLGIDTLKELYERTGKYPKYFGLGFFQLKVDDALRYHYYHRGLAPILNEEEVHDHRYSFDSEVLCGALTNKVFYYEESKEETDWELVTVTCKEGEDDVPIGLIPNVRKVELCTFTVPATRTYHVTPDLFHQVEYHENTVTKLTRGPIVKDTARIIRDKRTPYVCPYSAPISVEETWRYLGDILDPMWEY